MIYFFVLLQPMRLSPTGTVKGQLRFYGTRDSSIPISNPTMGTDILQFCHECFNISFSPEIKKSQNVLFFLCRLGHYTIPEEMDDVSKWLRSTLGL
jgi:hypothetical protein